MRTQCYTASVTCPLTDDEISILAAFVQGDTRQYQLIGQYTGLYSASFPRYDLYDTPLLFAIDTMNSLLRKGEQFSITRWIDEDSLTPSEPAQLRMGLFRDQKLGDVAGSEHRRKHRREGQQLFPYAARRHA